MPTAQQFPRLPHLPTFVPYPAIADDLFQYAEWLGLLFGLLAGIIAFRRSKSRGYSGLFWSRWFIGIVAAFILLAFAYVVLLNAIDTPPAAVMYGEAFLFFLIHAALAAAVALIIVLGPKGLIQALRSLWGA